MGGIPGLLLALAPPLFAIISPPIFASMAIPGLRWPFLVPLIVGALWFGSIYYNREIVAQKDAWLATDLAVERTNPGRNFGIFRAYIFPNGRQSGCIELCMRLLLSNQADSVVLGELTRDNPPRLNPNKTYRYHLEQRESCPAVNLPNSLSGQAMRLAVANGRCLIRTPGRLSDVTSATFQYRAKSATASQYAVGWDLYADTLSADRVDYFERQNGKLELLFRSNSIRYEPLMPLLVPGVNTGPELRIGAGFMRRTIKVGGIAYDTFVADTLGFNLKQDAHSDRGEQREALRDVLADSGATTDDPRFLVAEDYFQSFRKAEAFHDEDKALVLALLRDPRFQRFNNLSATTQTMHRLNVDGLDEVGDTILSRFRSFTPERRDREYFLRLGHAIKPFPDSFFGTRIDVLIEIANDPFRWQYAENFLVRLSAGDNRVVPVLLGLVDKLRSDEKPSTDASRRKSLYLAGLTGICRMGERASAALPALTRRLAMGSLLVSKYGSATETLIHTIISVGGDANAIWPYFDKAGMKRRTFDRAVKKTREGTVCR